MKIYLKPGLALVALVFAATINLEAVADGEDSISRGAENYETYCASCHGKDRGGLVNFEGQLEDLQLILEGETMNMPDFYGVFSEEEVADLFAFISQPMSP